MNTYTGGTQNNKQGGENHKETNQGEDLFLSGGFDSFGGTPEPANTGMGQMNAGMGQLGSVDYGSGNAYGTVDNDTMGTNRWSEPKIILNLWGQLFNSFVPFRYDRYKGMSVNAAKDFVKFFVKLYLLAGYLMLAVLVITTPEAMEYFKSGNINILLTIISLGISYAISAFLGPFFFRLQAFIYRVLFGKLICIIEGKKITSTNMYLVTIYACVPWMVISVFAVFVPLYILLSYIWPIVILELLLPVIIMALAIPRME